MVKTVGIVSLSSGVLGESFAAHELKIGEERLRALGLSVKYMLHAKMGMAYLRAHPAARAADLLAAFRDPEVDMILCAIGGGDALVGRGKYCDYPESVTELPVVQSGAETNIEEILALEPQIVLMSDMSQTEEQAKLLEQNGVKVVISDANDIAGVYTAIRMIGTLMAKNDEAEALIADMQATFDEIAAKSEKSDKTIYFEVSPLQWGLWTAGSGTFMDELATMCGVTNAFADISGWQSISEEQVIERNPDYIVSIAGMGDTAVEEILGRDGWGDISAVKNGSVYNADSNAISRPGPRLKDAAIELYDFVNGVEAEEAPAA